MTLECECCQAEPEFLMMIQLWHEYRVGSINSSERFFLCPTCERDPRVDPVELWAEEAAVYAVS